MARSRKFEDWEWRDPETRELIKLECRVETDGGKTTFSVVSKEHDVHDSGPDPNKLKDKIFRELQDRRVTAWSYWLHVFVGGESSWIESANHFLEEGGEHYEIRKSLTFYVDPVQLATRGDGKAVWNGRGSHGGNVHIGSPQVGAGDYSESFSSHKTHGFWSLVPDTPENRKALRVIYDGMGLLRERLVDLLKPDNIQASLDGVASGGLAGLPSPHAVHPLEAAARVAEATPNKNQRRRRK